MTITDAINGLLIGLADRPKDTTQFGSGWDAGYARGLEAALQLIEAWEVNK